MINILKYKINILSELKKAGYNTNVIRKENILNQSALQYIRRGQIIGPVPLDKICSLLHCQPGDILEWIPDEPEQNTDT